MVFTPFFVKISTLLFLSYFLAYCTFLLLFYVNYSYFDDTNVIFTRF